MTESNGIKNVSFKIKALPDDDLLNVVNRGELDVLGDEATSGEVERSQEGAKAEEEELGVYDDLILGVGNEELAQSVDFAETLYISGLPRWRILERLRTRAPHALEEDLREILDIAKSRVREEITVSKKDVRARCAAILIRIVNDPNTSHKDQISAVKAMSSLLGLNDQVDEAKAETIRVDVTDWRGKFREASTMGLLPSAESLDLENGKAI